MQTVRERQNPRLYRLLREFEAITGVPVLVNTSFNVKGEPIVETPRDALDCFLITGIDYLALHDTLISKSVLNDRRLERQASFMTSEGGVALWEDADGSWSRKRDLFRMLHHSRVARAAAVGK